jgi:hypothetical protein
MDLMYYVKRPIRKIHKKLYCSSNFWVGLVAFLNFNFSENVLADFSADPPDVRPEGDLHQVTLGLPLVQLLG